MKTTSNKRFPHHGFLLLLSSINTPITQSFLLSPQTITPLSSSSPLFAKRRKNQNSRDDLDTFNSWYDAVSDRATPDDVFWQEMERQKMFQDIGRGGSSGSSNANGSGSGGGNSPSMQNDELRMEIMDERTVESTLARYSDYMVNDNWLDDEYLDEMMDEFMMDDDDDDDDLEFELQMDEYDDDDDDDGVNGSLDMGDDVWDHWGEEEDDETGPPSRPQIRLIGGSDMSEFLLDDDDDYSNKDSDKDPFNTLLSDAETEESEHLQRLNYITITSRHLLRAASSPKAKTYFSRPPSQNEGYDRLWVSAVDEPCTPNLHGMFRNYGVEFADNFGDWKDVTLPADGLWSIEDVASYKAREVFKITGLPCIASRTSFEVEPLKQEFYYSRDGSGSGGVGGEGGGGGGGKMNYMKEPSPRVTSGYRFNNIGDHVDEIAAALQPGSNPERITRFRTCLCYYDGEMELFDYGECDVDLYFCNSLRMFIPMSSAINEMCKSLQLALGLEYQKWLKTRAKEVLTRGIGRATLKLRDKVLKEGKVLPNDIIDVSAFMDSMVDVELMDECGKELTERFLDLKPSKILTIATTGLVIAIPMARHLQIPVVYARKERNVVMSQTYQASYSSKTVGKNRELLVSQSHLSEEDRILIVDDFLSGASSQEALFRIVGQSGAKVVGVGVLMEKVYDSGRKALSGFNVRIESMVRVASVKDGIITLAEEDGFDLEKAI